MRFESDMPRTPDTENGLEKLDEILETAEAVVIGAGAGMSTSAGFLYEGERFERYFADFEKKYHFNDMYSGGFYPYDTLEEKWGFWSRNIYINRYVPARKPVYTKLFDLVKEKDYFVLTTNVDHQFQKAGFAKERIFYTQGDYGLWQCSKPCHKQTYDNKSAVVKMVLSQGFRIDIAGGLVPPVRENGETDWSRIRMTVPTELLPRCPVCGEPMSMNLRADATFVEDAGWFEAQKRYSDYLDAHENRKTLFLELGVGWNTPGIIKFAFWELAEKWKDATYACLNYGQAFIPEDLRNNSIALNGDIGEILNAL